MNRSVNNYMISNRAYDAAKGTYGDTVAPGGALTFFTAPVSSSSFVAVDYETWFRALQTDLNNSRQFGIVRGPGGGFAGHLPAPPAVATFFFHGFGVSFSAAETDFTTYFTNLASDQGGGYPGVLVGFDWPSNVGFEAAKQNARTSASESFPLLAAVLREIRQSQATYLGALCHSMGNYLMFAGAPYLIDNGVQPFDELLCVAAMLESTGFNSASSATYCASVVSVGNRVTLYNSVHDDVLPLAEDPGFDGYPELGIYGPGYDDCLLDRVVGVDCSAVVNEANAKKYEAGQPRILTHIAYFFIPETLADIAQTLTGAATSSLTDRRPIAGSAVGFLMTDHPEGGGASAGAASTGSLPWAAVAALTRRASGNT